jgi:hypothetical protein
MGKRQNSEVKVERHRQALRGPWIGEFVDEATARCCQIRSGPIDKPTGPALRSPTMSERTSSKT